MRVRSILTLILAAILIAVRSSHAAPSVVPTAAAQPITSAEPNAAQLYRQAFKRLPSESDKDYKVLAAYEPAIDETVDAFLERQVPTLELFHQAATIDRCDWGPTEDSDEWFKQI